MKKMFLPMALGLLSTCCMSCEVSAMINRGLTVQQCRDNARAASHLSGALVEDGMPLGTTVDSIAKGARALRAKGYGADGSDLPDSVEVTQARTDLATATGERDAARRDLATVTGERDTAQRDLATAQTNLAAVTGERDAFLGVFTGEAHLTDIDLRLLRAVFASGLTLNMRELKNAANPLSQLATVDEDAKVQGLPNVQGLDKATLQDPASDMVKFALLRGFFHSATHANHDQAELNGVSVTCTDGPISLGAGGLDLKVE